MDYIDQIKPASYIPPLNLLQTDWPLSGFISSSQYIESNWNNRNLLWILILKNWGLIDWIKPTEWISLSPFLASLPSNAFPMFGQTTILWLIFQTIKYDPSLCCSILATLRFCQFITVQSVKSKWWKLSINSNLNEIANYINQTKPT